MLRRTRMLHLVRALSRQAGEFKAHTIQPEHHLQLSFESLGVSAEMIEVLKKKGIEDAFPIQSATFTHAFNGHDIIARERTGSGKTIAYALPLIERLRKEHNLGSKSSPAAKVLVLVPTRELCVQVTREIESLQFFEGEIRVVSLYGGTDINRQIMAMKRGADFLVATPGRLWDHIERGTVDTSGISKVVLDETDEMLNIGFKEKITDIIQKVKRSSSSDGLQFLLFSATVPEWVKFAAREFMSDDIYYIDMVKDSEHKTAVGVRHLRMALPDELELPGTISHLIDEHVGSEGRTIVFTNTKAEANKIALEGKLETSVAVLHGDISQDRRQKTFDDFKIGLKKCLIATNVAARGLDFPKVDLVIQIGAPAEVESYIHRSGRTGRAGHSGICITLYSRGDMTIIKEIERKAKIEFEEVAPISQNKILQNKAEKLKASIEAVKTEASEAFTNIAIEIIEKYGPQQALSRTIALYLDYTKPQTVYSSHKSRPDMTTIKLIASQMIEDLLTSELHKLLYDKYFINDNKALICNVSNNDLEKVQAMLEAVEGIWVSYPQSSTRQHHSEGYSSDRRSSYDKRGGWDNNKDSRTTRRPVFSSGESNTKLIDQIFFTGLSSQAKEADLVEALNEAGISFRSVKVFKDRDTGIPKDSGLITPSSQDDLEKLLDLGSLKVEGRPVKFKKNQVIGR